jgi:protoporphyrinogen/coproporphyrinogen III oxidase
MEQRAATDVDVIVIGGGITGLAAAYFIARDRPGTTVRVLEASAAVGGKIAGAEVAGIAVDTGPDAFLARVPGAVELAHELGLGDDLVSPATGSAYVWSRGALRALPAGLVLGVPTQLRSLASSHIISTRGFLRAALDEVLPRRSSGLAADPTVAEAIGRHLGREVVERLVDPLLGGINASDCDTLSLASAAPNLATSARAPRLMRALRASGAAAQRGQIGVTEERPIFLAPRSGIRSLVSELRRRVEVTTDAAVLTVAVSAPGWTVTTATETLRGRSIVLATPAAASARLLKSVAPVASRELDGIRTASVALTLLAYPADSLRLPPGSGMLVPRPEQRLVTASSWWNQKWPHLDTHGHVLIRASAGRDGDTRFTDLDDAELVDALHDDLREMIGAQARPVDARVSRWMHGFPQYDSGHAARVERIENSLATTPGLCLAGASFRGIGVPACIRDAQRAAKATVAHLAPR